MAHQAGLPHFQAWRSLSSCRPFPGPRSREGALQPHKQCGCHGPRAVLNLLAFEGSRIEDSEGHSHEEETEGLRQPSGMWKPFGELARPGGPWLSAPSRHAVIWLDIFPHAVRMSQTWRRGPGLVIIQAQGVEGQLLAVIITMFSGDGRRSEESLKLNSETACGNDPMNE